VGISHAFVAGGNCLVERDGAGPTPKTLALHGSRGRPTLVVLHGGMLGCRVMDLWLANPRGYCAGVDRAIDIVELAIDLYGPPIYVRHEIVHNHFVVDRLRARGAVFVDELVDVPAGSIVVFSAHGVSPAVRAEATARGLRSVDATCPLVTKVHLEALRFAGQGNWLLLIGHAGHAEVEGTMGEAPERTILIQSVEDAERVEVPDPERVVYLTQTTLSLDETREIIEALRRRFPKLRGPAREDICYATQNRQNAVKELARHCELVLVVGSTISSNSNRLVEVARETGAEAHLVETADDVRPEWLAGKRTAGVTSGASTPEDLVAGVVERLREAGAGPARDLTVTEERMVFQLPSALTRDLKAAGREQELLARFDRVAKAATTSPGA
jgi:4-hydroxy-3-methylbut-2-enyl diphosphate reductase